MKYIDSLVMAAEGYRHQWYDRTKKLADEYIAFYTGEGMDQFMRRFDKREDDELFAQRCRITQHITKTVLRNLIKPQYKVPRANNIQRIITYRGDRDNSQSNVLEEIMDKFNGSTSVDEYMRDEWIKLSNIDPNAFIILEWKPFDSKTKNAQPYPFEVYAEDVYDFDYQNRILDYLLVYSHFIVEVIEDGRVKEVERERYTLYNKIQTITLSETDVPGIPYDTNREFASGDILTTKDNKNWLVEFITPHNLGFVPAVRVGYAPITNSR